MTRRPPDPVLAAFDAAPAVLRPLHGGQGMAWSAGRLILKPLDMSLDALEWQEAVLSDIAEDGFRLARPVRSSNGELAPWWPSLLRVAAELCQLAANTPK